MSNFTGFSTDNHGRRPRYMRLSVTDRCNLRCSYCVSCERQRFIPHERILRYEEFYRLAAIASSLGVLKLRITGGEPFSRRGIMGFLSGLRSRFPRLQLAITTNATLLGPHIEELAKLGLASVNISLDSFDPATFRRITGSDSLAAVLAAIERLLSLGQRVKINAVALAGVTDLQINDFVSIARTEPVDVRFIEFMPMGGNTIWDESSYISGQELQRLVEQQVGLIEQPGYALAGPARMFAVANGRGRIGFISAVSNHFCGSCNRMRITSEGRLRTCLFADSEVDLARLLRNPRITDEHIARAMRAALLRKPLGADLLAARSAVAVARRQMVAIGG